MLSYLGQREPALQAAHEAVELYRELAARSDPNSNNLVHRRLGKMDTAVVDTD